MMHLIRFLGLTCLLIFPLASHAGNAAQAQVMVENAMQESLAIINNPSIDKNTKRKQLWPVVKRYFDFNLITSLTLGKFSAEARSPLGEYSDRRFTTAQQREFTGLFTTHLGNIYLDKLNDDRRFTVRITQSAMLKSVKSMQRARVNTLINSKTSIDYSLRLKNNNWRVYDIRVEGRSLISSFRKEYNALLLKQSPAHLLSQLRDKNIAYEQARTTE